MCLVQPKLYTESFAARSIEFWTKHALRHEALALSTEGETKARHEQMAAFGRKEAARFKAYR